MAASKRLKTLRILVILNLVLMLVLLLFGVSAESPSGTAASALSLLQPSGAILIAHMLIGLVLGAVSLANLFFSLRSGLRRIQLSGLFAFLSILTAGIGGIFFVLSNFRNTAILFALFPLFISAVVFYILEYVFLSRGLRSQAA